MRRVETILRHVNSRHVNLETKYESTLLVRRKGKIQLCLRRICVLEIGERRKDYLDPTRSRVYEYETKSSKAFCDSTR